MAVSGRGGKAARSPPNDLVRPQDRDPATPPSDAGRGGRTGRSAARRDAILAAALDAFGARGFAGTRLDDIALGAGVAKGTLYLYFADKEALFQELVRAVLVPQVEMLEDAQHSRVPVRALIEQFFERMVRDVFGTRRRDVLRLMISEGHRFPHLAEFYYREVVERAVRAMRILLEAAAARGELRGDALVRYPQLLISPLLMALVWDGLFGRFEPLDVQALVRAHLDTIFGEGQTA